MTGKEAQIVVIGAGIGGLATALRLTAAGHKVIVLEQHGQVGGKIRTVPSAAGPVDAGPTVMTMRPVFEDLFAAAGQNLSDHVTLTPQMTLARHHWSDGSSLDLFADPDRSQSAVAALSGSKDAAAFARFSAQAKQLFDAFEAPMMHAAQPDQAALTMQVLRNPRLLHAMSPLQSLAKHLSHSFADPRLRQLFGRYATYVGGSPYETPALLKLIWQAEAMGVWTVKGGMHKLATAIADLIAQLGGEVHLNTACKRVEFQGGGISSVITEDGQRFATNTVVYNGDPRALAKGLMGASLQAATHTDATEPRSLSAYVWSFAAKASGKPLVHHNVFFGDDPNEEFSALKAGQMPKDPTLYVCAQDRGDDAATPDHPERFEIIVNGPPALQSPPDQEFDLCHQRTFRRLSAMGLHFDPEPQSSALTTPAMFDHLFPGSAGSLYGRSPHGLTASLKRPTTRTKIPGLYLAGGGAHPGAGIPMATLSGKHAAEAILQDRTSTSMSPKTATRGGMSMGSATTAPVQSRSSAS